MDFVLVASFVAALMVALLQVLFTLHTKGVLEAATEEAARVAAAYNGDTAAGERRFRQLATEVESPNASHALTWTWTLDTVTLRVRSTLPLVGNLGPAALVTTASAFHETWH